MSDQVFRYRNKEEFADGTAKGVAVSPVLGLEELIEIRDRLQKKDSEHFYGIVHYASFKMYTLGQHVGMDRPPKV